MEGNPIARERAAVAAMASALQAGDVVNAVTWSDDQVPVLEGHTVTGPDDPVLVSLAASLEANGSTNLEAGLRTSYDLANKYRGAGRLNRVVLISDGQANVGIASEELIGANAEDQDAEGTYLVGVGVGDGVNDTLMNVVTDAGRGAVTSPSTARRRRRASSRAASPRRCSSRRATCASSSSCRRT